MNVDERLYTYVNTDWYCIFATIVRVVYSILFGFIFSSEFIGICLFLFLVFRAFIEGLGEFCREWKKN